MSTEPHFLENLYRDLSLALGDAVWAFARVEWLTYEFIGRLSRDKIDELVGDIGFRPRVAILRRIVERQEADEEMKKLSLALLSEAEKLSDQRNVIVHNPWKVWIDIDAEQFMTEIQKYSNSQRKVDLADVRRFTETAEQLEHKLRAALNEL